MIEGSKNIRNLYISHFMRMYGVEWMYFQTATVKMKEYFVLMLFWVFTILRPHYLYIHRSMHINLLSCRWKNGITITNKVSKYLVDVVCFVLLLLIDLIGRVCFNRFAKTNFKPEHVSSLLNCRYLHENLNEMDSFFYPIW